MAKIRQLDPYLNSILYVIFSRGLQYGGNSASKLNQ